MLVCLTISMAHVSNITATVFTGGGRNRLKGCLVAHEPTLKSTFEHTISRLSSLDAEK